MVRQSVSAMLLQAGSAGTYVFGVAAQDFESAIDSYRIRTYFVHGLGAAEKATDGDRDNDPEIDGLRSTGFGSTEPRVPMSEFCRNQDEDADGTFFCATPVTTDHDAVAS